MPLGPGSAPRIESSAHGWRTNTERVRCAISVRAARQCVGEVAVWDDDFAHQGVVHEGHEIVLGPHVMVEGPGADPQFAAIPRIETAAKPFASAIAKAAAAIDSRVKRGFRRPGSARSQIGNRSTLLDIGIALLTL